MARCDIFCDIILWPTVLAQNMGPKFAKHVRSLMCTYEKQGKQTGVGQ